MAVAIVLVALSSAIMVQALVTQKFPVTIQVSVREPLVLTGPTPANGTLFAASSKNFTLSFRNLAGPVSSILYFTTNSTGWNCPGCGIYTQPFSMAIGAQIVAPAYEVGGGSYCGNPIGDSRCSYGLTVPSGQSSVIATFTAGSNAPIVDFTITFFLAR